jgi:hypothetical protein
LIGASADTVSGSFPPKIVMGIVRSPGQRPTISPSLWSWGNGRKVPGRVC